MIDPTAMLPSAATCLLVAIAAGDATAQSAMKWTVQSPPMSPAASYGVGIAFDDTMGKIVLFGGSSSSAQYDSTWTFDGTDWLPINPVHRPSPRIHPSAAFDSLRGRIVLFGGWDGTTRLNDTWEFDGVDWTQCQPIGASPQPRDSHAIAFDRARGRVVLFGGRGPNIGGSDLPLGDTWEWDGAAWQQMNAPVGPPPRWEHNLAYDEARGRVVLFGGANDNGELPSATWLWDGANWQLTQPSASPLPRHGAGMVYDAARAKVVLFGGLSSGVYTSETWEWDGQDWAAFASAWPPAGRWEPAMAYDRARQQTVLFGGIGTGGSSVPSAWLSDTWTYEPVASASVTPFGAGCPGPLAVAPTLDAVPNELPMVGTTSHLRISGLPSSFLVPLVGLGFSNTWAGGPGGLYPLPLDLSPLGWSGCYQRVSILDLAIANYVIGSGYADHAITLPPMPFLAGMRFYAQAIVLHDGGGVSFTNGVAAVVGP